MSSEFLSSALLILIALTWTIYLSQEIFITGSSFLSLFVGKSESDKKQIQWASGLHWDGIEVWLIAALVITLGGFPIVYSTIYTHLYVIMYLFLYALIARGVLIETMHKYDNEKYRRIAFISWAIASALVILLLGVFVTNLFYGLPLDANGITGNFLSIFNTTNLSGGLLFLILAMISGASWIEMTTEGEMGQKALTLISKLFLPVLVPVLLLLIFMGFNTNDRLFVGELFTNQPILFVLPALTIVFAIAVLYFGQKKKTIQLFIFTILTIATYLLTGFIGSFPYALSSSIDVDFGLKAIDAMTQLKSASIIFITTLIFFPLVIGYQTWKYLRFKNKVTKNLD